MHKKLPPHQNDEEFESFCLALWKKVWNDPHAQKYSTNPKGQKGVDIIGYPNGGSDRCAIQCKVRSKSEKLTNSDIKADAESAQQHDPPLKELIFATTAGRDPNTQDYVARLSREYQAKGLFRILVYSWEDIEELVDTHPEVALLSYPTYLDTATKLSSSLYKKYKAQELAHSDIQRCEQVLKVYEETFSFVRSISEIEPEQQEEDTEASNLLNEIRDNLNSDKITKASEKLKQFEENYLRVSTNNENFRYYYYLGDIANELHQQQECATYFSKAYESNPNHKSANKLKALALLIEGNPHEAGLYAEKAIASDPCDELAYQVLVQSCPEKSIDEIIKPIPEDKKNEPGVALGIAEVARRKGNIELCIAWMEKALQTSNSYKVKLYYAQALYEWSFKKSILSHFGVQAAEVEQKLRTANQLVDNLLAQISDNPELYQAKVYLLINKANALRLLRQYEAALVDFEKYFTATKKLSSDKYPVNEQRIDALRLRALLSLDMNHFSEAEKFLKQIPDTEMSFETHLMLAETFRFQNRYDEAVEEIHKSGSITDTEYSVDAQRLLIHILIDKGDFASATKQAEEGLERCRDIDSLTGMARVLLAGNKQEEATKLLKEAESLLCLDTPARMKLDLAMLWYELQKYTKSASLLESLNPIIKDTFITRKLIYSYLLDGKEGKALQICKSLRENCGIVDYAAELESNLLEKIGDYEKAKQVYQQILSADPTNFRILVRKAVMDMQLDCFSELDEFLRQSFIVDEKISLDNGLFYVFLLKERGFLEKAFQVLYELRRVYFNEPQAHLKYAGLVNEQASNTEYFFKREKVELDTAVLVEYSTGKSDWLILEDRSKPDIRFKEINEHHPLFKELVDKTVGDLLSNNAKIVELKHKYLFAYQESISRYQEFFPANNEIQIVEIPNNPENSTLDNLKPILERIDVRTDNINQAIKIYNTGPFVTIGSLAESLGLNPIQTWGGLIGKPDRLLISTTGNENERNYALRIIQDKNKTLVLDLISLLTMHELGILEKVKHCYESLATSWSTIQTIKEYIIEARWTLENGFITISKEGEQYIRYEIRPEQIQKEIKSLESLCEWIRKNCSLMPMYGYFEIDKGIREEFRIAIGKCFFDCMVLAKEPNHILCSDDQRLREIAFHTYKTPGVWIQILLFDMHRNEQLTNNEFSNYVLRLVELGYDYVSLNWLPIIESCRRADWKCEGIFEKVASIIFSDKTTIKSSMGVLTQFLFELWRQDISVDQKEEILKFSLTTLMDGLKSRGIFKIKKELDEFTEPDRIWEVELPYIFDYEPWILKSFKKLISFKFRKMEFTRIQVLNIVLNWQHERVLSLSRAC